MKNDIKAKARAFLKEYRLSEVTLEDLKKIIRSQGFTIIEYNHILNDENVARLIEALGVAENAQETKGFTYADSNRRLVFIHEDLSDDEKRLVLAHEEGHIYCGHFSAPPIIGRDVLEEHEANEFTHYILKNGAGQKLIRAVKAHKKVVWTVAILLIVFAISLTAFHIVQKERGYYGEFYLTATGSKYHNRECAFVKNKTNVHRMTVEEFESGKYEPCEKCLLQGDVSEN